MTPPPIANRQESGVFGARSGALDGAGVDGGGVGSPGGEGAASGFMDRTGPKGCCTKEDGVECSRKGARVQTKMVKGASRMRQRFLARSRTRTRQSSGPAAEPELWRVRLRQAFLPRPASPKRYFFGPDRYFFK